MRPCQKVVKPQFLDKLTQIVKTDTNSDKLSKNESERSNNFNKTSATNIIINTESSEEFTENFGFNDELELECNANDITPKYSPKVYFQRNQHSFNEVEVGEINVELPYKINEQVSIPEMHFPTIKKDQPENKKTDESDILLPLEGECFAQILQQLQDLVFSLVIVYKLPYYRIAEKILMCIYILQLEEPIKKFKNIELKQETKNNNLELLKMKKRQIKEVISLRESILFVLNNFSINKNSNFNGELVQIFYNLRKLNKKLSKIIAQLHYDSASLLRSITSSQGQLITKSKYEIINSPTQLLKLNSVWKRKQKKFFYQRIIKS